MPITRSVRTGVLTIHGVLALGLGLAFFYLSATMTNMFFEVFAVVVAIVLAAAALILDAITDWFAALGTDMKNVHRIMFYLLAGVAFTLAGVFLGYYPAVYMQWLLAFTAVHALVFGIASFVSAFNPGHDRHQRQAMGVLGTISILFPGQ